MKPMPPGLKPEHIEWCREWVEQPTVDAVLEAISADGPVIVVDGKVVELTDIDFAFLPDTWTEQVLDAAREVIDE